MSISDELDFGDWILVGEDGLVDVTKIKTPDLDVLVGWAGDQQIVVGRNIKSQNWQGVSIEI